jgi:hypothetical protein
MAIASDKPSSQYQSGPFMIPDASASRTSARAVSTAAIIAALHAARSAWL